MVRRAYVKAVVTLKSEVTGNHFTYKVKKHEEKPLYFVSVLAEGENSNDNAYKYLGLIICDDNTNKFILTKASKASNKSKSFLAFKYVYDKLVNDVNIKDVSIYHEGVCGKCGRKLTTPDSIERGFGPVCLGSL